MEQSDQVERYRYLRGIAGKIQHDALELVQYPSLLEFGRRIGVASHHELVYESESDLKLVYDLATHTARPGRTRAIDRYARSASFPPDSDEYRILRALQQARFTVFRFESRHPVAGGIVSDALQERQFHFMDVSVGLSATRSQAFAGRLVEIDGYSMSCLTIVPITEDLLERACARFPPNRHGNMAEQFQDPRYAAAFYRAAVETGIMQRCVSFDPAKRLPTESDVKSIMGITDHLSADLPALTAVY